MATTGQIRVRGQPRGSAAPGASFALVVTTLLSVAILHGAYVLWAGQAISPDALAYAHWSERLLDSGFDYPRIVREAKAEFPPVLYGLFVTILALLRMLFDENWLGALLGLNFAAHVGLGFLIVRTAVKIAHCQAAGWIALLLFLGCHDLVVWVRYILSDTTFVLLAFTILTLAAARILGIARGWLPVVLPALAAIFYRPTGILMMPVIAWAAFLNRERRLPGSGPALLAALAALSLAAALLFVWLMQDPDRWPFETLSTAFQTVAGGYAAGEVVHHRSETYHAPPDGLGDHLLLVADRFVHFFAIGAEGFSSEHWLGAVAFYVPTYLLAAWLGVALWRRDHRFGEREHRVFLAAAGAVLVYALFHAFVQVDYDWRYRTPVLPLLILLASGGAADLMRRVRRS